MSKRAHPPNYLTIFTGFFKLPKSDLTLCEDFVGLLQPLVASSLVLGLDICPSQHWGLPCVLSGLIIQQHIVHHSSQAVSSLTVSCGVSIKDMIKSRLQVRHLGPRGAGFLVPPDPILLIEDLIQAHRLQTSCFPNYSLKPL